MSKITAINISSIDIDEIFEWLNNIKNELED